MGSETNVYPVDLPTPPASSTNVSQHPSPLPQPRRRPLQPGGTKESELIRYLDHGVNHVQKRVDNRVNKKNDTPAITEADGYRAFWEVAKDLDGLVDVVWVSGSPNLQVPYLLNLAVLTAEFLPLFSVSARSTQATFKLLSKLDYAFFSLLTGHDTATGEPLPGFENGRTVSTTDKVRLKGVVDRTRLTVVRAMEEESVVDDDKDTEEATNTDMDTDNERATPVRGSRDTVTFEGFEDNEEDDEWEERNIGSIYEKTIGELGDVLGGPPIGIITDDWGVNGTDRERRGPGFVESEDVIEM